MDENTLFNYVNKLSPITLELITCETDEQFNKAFSKYIEATIIKLESNAVNFESLPENGLNAVFALALSNPEISATQEENSNGHVDITVRVNRAIPQRRWLIEAKLWDGPVYHISGLGQLLNRYMTGREGCGYVISYVRKKKIKDKINELRHYMDIEQPLDMEGLCQDHSIKWSFLSNHLHSSGENLNIIHVGCNLYTGDRKKNSNS